MCIWPCHIQRTSEQKIVFCKFLLLLEGSLLSDNYRYIFIKNAILSSETVRHKTNTFSEKSHCFLLSTHTKIWILVFRDSPTLILALTLTPSIGIFSSQFGLTTEDNLVSQWEGEFEVLFRFISSHVYFLVRFYCRLILEHSSRWCVHSSSRLCANSTFSFSFHFIVAAHFMIA